MVRLGTILGCGAALLLAGCDAGKPQPTATEPAAAQASSTESETATEKAAPKSKEASPSSESQPAKAPASSPASQPNAKKPALPDDQASGTTQLYGAAFVTQEPALPLSKAIANAGDSKAVVKVEASIEKVCQKKGCWFTLEAPDVDRPVRVRMKDYGFFVPRNVMGAKVVLEGTLHSRELPQEEAQHYADESGDPQKKVGPQKVYEFTATGVEVSTSAT